MVDDARIRCGDSYHRARGIPPIAARIGCSGSAEPRRSAFHKTALRRREDRMLLGMLAPRLPWELGELSSAVRPSRIEGIDVSRRSAETGEARARRARARAALRRGRA